MLTEDYIRIVQELQPRFLVIENVLGFTLPFKKHGDTESRTVPYSHRVITRLKELNYEVFSQLIDLSAYGVPQSRKRFIIIAIRENDPALKLLGKSSPFDLLNKRRKHFLGTKKLPHNRPVSVEEAIGDLATRGADLIECNDSAVRGFKQIDYRPQKNPSPFIRLMRKGTKEAPNSLRLPNHAPKTIAQFVKITNMCTRGKVIDDISRKALGIKKHAITPLAGNQPSATITTLPDDIIHYAEPRILTVRENARIQTFPDWFQFKGNYTTGGKERKGECPRYSQVGNAVPPLFSEALGRLLKHLAEAKPDTPASS